MNTIFTKYRFGILSIFILCIGGLTACKKNKSEEATTTTTAGVPSTGSRRELTLDSLFLYAKQIYFWNDALPEYSTFNPRQYSSKSVDLDNYDDELYAITQLKLNPATGKAYEYYGDGFPKYSYIEDITTANPAVTSSVDGRANVDTEGNGYDIGIRPVYYLVRNSDTYYLFITAVYPGSPAAAAGVQRGWVITKVNGTAIGTNYSTERSSVSAALDGASVKIEGYNYVDKVPFNLTLNRASYKSSPVYASKVIVRPGKKIGYLAFARFSALTNQDAPSDTNLDPVFSNFSTQGITDLVVDLRYNGGGYIQTAEYLANLIAPSGTTGKKMYTEIYNTAMQANPKTTIMVNQPLLTSAGKVQFQDGKRLTYADIDYSQAGNTTNFTKQGTLNSVTNVVFIVSGSTASASELLINSLKPYMTVQLVGGTTYGKPVGFFPITLEHRYDVYMSLFETRNANNEGGYYAGMVPGTVVDDNSQYPFGDEREQNLSAALNLIAPGSVSSQSAASSVKDRSSQVSSFSYSGVKPANPHSEFVGMIEKKHNLKK
ncbi:S41 family peptidase [Pedobacter hartonius]|uniref:PDZ domain-containing protein n=1 Tax=Pedobacter hartonius TaxID=425514 RepID=A0A1H4CG14_9SPHI|nr:S41 family peptidase [Pedobacter hartonius]SEA59012.1 PDZ domain-containing protein [Pedobacter hartonius]